MNKFKIGDSVTVNHPVCGTWTGIVVSCKMLEADVYEYGVTNAPPLFPGSPLRVLAWEEEMEYANH